ncbi:MAG: UPF0489 family protein [Candidatus Saganbacteria bacterium]|nr:UPF0489 family protein [Candidatus Saganbacteria bacterium]
MVFWREFHGIIIAKICASLGLFGAIYIHMRIDSEAAASTYFRVVQKASPEVEEKIEELFEAAAQKDGNAALSEAEAQAVEESLNYYDQLNRSSLGLYTLETVNQAFGDISRWSRGMLDPEIKAKLLEHGYALDPLDGALHSTYITQRPAKHDPGDWTTPLIAGTVEDIREGTHRVFSKYTGLENCVRIEKEGKPVIYVVDNHNMAFFAWEESLAMGAASKGSELVHIDAHSDSSAETGLFSGEKIPERLATYTLETLIPGTFIVPAVADGTIKDFWFFYSSPKEDLDSDGLGKLVCTRKTASQPSYACESNDEYKPQVFTHPWQRAVSLSTIVSKTASGKLILDIDLDAFVGIKEGQTEEEFAKTIELMKTIARKASVITIATSPGFANQKVAVDLAKRIVRAITQDE